MADSSVPHRTNIRPNLCLHTKPNRIEALAKEVRFSIPPLYPDWNLGAH